MAEEPREPEKVGGPFDDLALSRQLLNLNREQIKWYIAHHAEVKDLLAKAKRLFASLPE